MNRVHVVGPADQCDAVLAAVQDAGVLDADDPADAREPPTDLVAQRAEVERAIIGLEQCRKLFRRRPPGPERSDPYYLAAIATVDRVGEILTERGELLNELSTLTKERRQIEPWGTIDPEDLAFLRRHGVHVQLFQGAPKQIAGLDLSESDWFDRFPLPGGDVVGVVAVTVGEPLEVEQDPVVLPSRSQRVIEWDIADIETELLVGRSEMRELSAYLPAVKRYLRHLEDEVRYAQVRARVQGDPDLFVVGGWCPRERIAELRKALAEHPAAVLVDEPGDDDQPPIEFRNPAGVRQFQPLLGMFDLPSYREVDPTPFIALPMALFVGFCLGDLGYGVILTLASLWAMARFQPRGQTRLVVQWLTILGLSTVLIGGLMGNVFGTRLYELLELSPTAGLFALSHDPKVFFFVALGFGVVQLTLGMLIRLVAQLGRAEWQRAVGTMGWLSVMPGIGAWVMADTPWVFVAALALVAAFASPNAGVVRRVGGGAWALYSVTSLIGDVMSYVRIFGLGLSSGILAMVVNTIALLLADISVIGWPLAVVFLFVGHTFNFALAMVGAVVHSARLQFLEFFGKFFEGGGRAYRPFAKLEGD